MTLAPSGLRYPRRRSRTAITPIATAARSSRSARSAKSRRIAPSVWSTGIAPVSSPRGGALGDLRLLRDADRLERRHPRRARARLRRGAGGQAACPLPRARAAARGRWDALLPRGADRGDARPRRARRRGGRARALAPVLGAVSR